MSRFAQSPESRFQSRGNRLWHSGGDLVGDFVSWDAEIEAYQGFKEAGNVIAEMEQWDAETYTGAHIEGDIAPWDGTFFGPGYIEADFQLWHATIWGDLGMITASFQPFTADYPYGISARYAFNNILADVEVWNADISCGAYVTAEFTRFLGSSSGTVGMSLGLSASFFSFMGNMYGGAAMVPTIETWTAEMAGSVTHVDRITADFALWSGEIYGDASRGADIEASMRMFTGVMSATQANPASIAGTLVPWTGYIDAIPGGIGDISGSLFLWGGTARLYGAHGFPPEIIGDLPVFDGVLKQDPDKTCSGTLTHIRGTVR